MPSLLDPLKVKDVVLRNRIVLPPMQSGRATFEGAVTNRLINFYVKRAPAIGLVIVEHAYVSLLGKLSPKQLGIYDDSLVDGFRKLAVAVHEMETPVVLQITHAGGVANRNVIKARPAGPSACGKTRELQREELDMIADEFSRAARRAVDAGFDGVELHGAHGYLLNQFFTPLLNKREDEFGGSLKNRMRFPLMVVDRLREVLDDKLLMYRVGADDLTPKGTQIKDGVAFSVELEKHGVDILDVTGGMCGADPKQLRGVRGYFVSQANAVKEDVKVPVIGVGRIGEASYADSLVKEGKVDLVAVGRALLEDSSWAEKAIEKLEKTNS